MATDIWNGSGDWNTNPSDWASGAPPGTSDSAIIQSGTATLSTSAAVGNVRVVPNATLNLADGATLTTTTQLLNGGTLNITGNGDT